MDEDEARPLDTPLEDAAPRGTSASKPQRATGVEPSFSVEETPVGYNLTVVPDGDGFAEGTLGIAVGDVLHVQADPSVVVDVQERGVGISAVSVTGEPGEETVVKINVRQKASR